MSSITLFPVDEGTMSPQNLDPDHFDALDKALSHLLATKITRQTIAQLIDGLPLFDVIKWCLSANNLNGSPLESHTELCPGSLECADRFIAAFSVAQLHYEPALLQAFQSQSPDTEPFLVRLIELVARAIHTIAVSIHKTAKKTHLGSIQEAVEYQTPPMVMQIGRNTREYLYPTPPVTPFCHANYTEHEQYPNGPSDVAGFWAEEQVFGGVVLFDRGESGKEAKSIWLHSSKIRWATRIWKPLEWQMTAMKRFFKSGRLEDIAEEAATREQELVTLLTERRRRTMREQWRGGFPFFCDIDNLERHDDWDAMKLHNIYKDSWERTLPECKPDTGPLDTFNYPELRGMAEAIMYASDVERQKSSVTPNAVHGNIDAGSDEGSPASSGRKRKRDSLGNAGADSARSPQDTDEEIEDEPQWTGGEGIIWLGQFDGKTFNYVDDKTQKAVEQEKERVLEMEPDALTEERSSQ